MTRRHLVIPDTQVKKGVPTAHLEWIGAYAAEKRPDVIIHLGDHWDMPSLSSWDRGKAAAENRRYEKDIDAGNDAFELLDAPIKAEQRARRSWRPRKVFLIGNHENRIERAYEDEAWLDGAIGYDDLDTRDWEVHRFLKPVRIDGISYAHYFYNPMTGRAYGGQAHTRLKTIGQSFTMGHQQTLDYALRFVGGRSHHGLIAGACYLHDEDYKGPQGNAHWRGVIVKNEVAGGSYDPMFLTLGYLCRRYEGVSLAQFMRGRKAAA